MISELTHCPTGLLHAVVWIDHHEAKVFRFDSEVSRATHRMIRAEHSPTHLHHKANCMGSGHAPVNYAYLDTVAADIRDASEILIVGPSGAKHEFYEYLQQHHCELLNRIVGVETVDHPQDGTLLAHAAQSFRAAARLGLPYSARQS